MSVVRGANVWKDLLANIYTYPSRHFGRFLAHTQLRTEALKRRPLHLMATTLVDGRTRILNKIELEFPILSCLNQATGSHFNHAMPVHGLTQRDR